MPHLMLDEYVVIPEGTRNYVWFTTERRTLWLAKMAFGGKSGARDLRNLIRRKVEDQLHACSWSRSMQSAFRGSSIQDGELS